MTYNEICQALAQAGIENNRAEAAMLIGWFAGVNKADLLTMRDTDFENEELENAVIKRISNYPLPYILKFWGFCNESYRVTEDTLIPRPDTEKLVELAVKLMPAKSRFIDLCTGSGCVAISTLAAREDTSAVAVDKFEKAVEVARENAESNGVGQRLGLLVADVLSPEFMEDLGKFDCILSNPPYIETQKIPLLDEGLSFEPASALDGGSDGLEFYRAIIGGYGKYLKEGGIMLLEIGFDQAKSVGALAAANGFGCEVFKDYGGNDRVAYLRAPAYNTGSKFAKEISL